MTQTLFLAWRDPSDRRWYPIGRLRSHDGVYIFGYTRGALLALESGRFQMIPQFPELHASYESHQLFPLFANRILPKSRPEYQHVLEWLCVPEKADEPFAILARSGAQRTTDTFEVFPCPEKNENGRYELYFLLHGLSHMPPDAIKRVEELVVGEPLLLMHDFQNPKDESALALRTAETFNGDMHIVGYCPRYLRQDILTLRAKDQQNELSVTVARVNPSPASIQYRILCKIEMQWPDGFEPFTDDEYRPILGRSSSGSMRTATAAASFSH